MLLMLAGISHIFRRYEYKRNLFSSFTDEITRLHLGKKKFEFFFTTKSEFLRRLRPSQRPDSPPEYSTGFEMYPVCPVCVECGNVGFNFWSKQCRY